ncbi:hypothetical protein [Cellulomonas marina]|uniref:ACT domain-containing protein n=1 Tax=Cellulomonas marina TaxID=988821 RepID=A0A1I1A9B6_9CELL|nr:hypothetical protein [Cellulomonas marina]GIG30415.1 hypothetical protein Cma02nite_30150 [Cellulomonas marina]SFB34555.1 hypothetical protein SAMN05421867_11631 [Cellulomonas marina]
MSAPDEGRAPLAAEDEERWVAYVRADHRTGTVAALAGVFATRGVNFDSLAGSPGSRVPAADGTVEPGLVVVTFWATPRRQRLLTRSVERLAAVRRVQVRSAGHPDVRAAAVVRLPARSTFRPPDDSAVRWTGEPQGQGPLLVEGRLADVEAVLDAAEAAGAVASAVVLEPLPPAELMAEASTSILDEVHDGAGGRAGGGLPFRDAAEAVREDRDRR